jgi:hypothetical protein
MAHITETVFLSTGVEHNGKAQREVVLRIGIVADSIETEQECDGSGLLIKSLTLLKKQILKFGAIPLNEITVDLLGMLTETDLDLLREAGEMLKKKALWQRRD